MKGNTCIETINSKLQQQRSETFRLCNLEKSNQNKRRKRTKDTSKKL